MLRLIQQFFQKHREWRWALPLILFFFVMNVIIRSTDYERFHAFHTLGDYLLLLVLWGTAFISLVRAKKTILANLSLLLVLWLVAEIFFFFLMGMPFRPLYSYPTKKLKTDAKLNQLGYLPDPSQAINHKSVVDGDTLFDVDYTIDAMHRRIVPENPARIDSIEQKAFALFLGCSVTYGFGVEDNETLPYYFEQYHPEYKAYNYAYKGYGTQNALAHLERNEIRSELEESEGFAVYVFLWSHVNRVIGDMRTYSWGWRLPYYTRQKEGVLRKGNFADDRRMVSAFYEWALQSQIIKYFDVSFPARIQSSHLELTADIIQQTQKRYEEKFGNNRFYVLLYPGDFSWIDEEMKASLLQMLEERNVKILDGYENVLTLDEAHKVPGDPHPNGLAHDIVGKKLADDIRTLEAE